ncbi:MAG: TolC family protein [Phycisphaerales bacterium]
MRRIRSSAPCRRARVAVAALILAGAPLGCQSYEPRPLDLESTRAAWLSRAADDARVREFAGSLAGAEGLQPGFDPRDGLSLREAEAVALVYSADLRLARLQAGVARASATFAGQWEDPVLGVDLERIVSGVGGANPWVVGSTIGFTIPLSGRLQAQRQQARAELAEALDQAAAKEWATRSALRELWIEWSAAGRREGIASELVFRLGEIVSVAARQQESGVISRLEAGVFRVELAAQEADLSESRATTRRLEQQIRALIGLPPSNTSPLVPALVIRSRADEPQALLLALEDTNPELAAVRAAYESSEHALRTEIRKQYPDLTIGPGYGSEQGDNRLLLGLSLPVPLWNRNQQGIARASAQRELARARFETTYEKLSSRLAQALDDLDDARARREQIEQSLLPLAEAQEADARRVAGLGRFEPLLLLETLKSRASAQQRLVEARAAESISAVRVDELVGPPSPPPHSSTSSSSEPAHPQPDGTTSK